MGERSFRLKYTALYLLMPAAQLAFALFALMCDVFARSESGIYMRNLFAIATIIFTAFFAGNGMLRRINIDDEITFDFYLRKKQQRRPLGSAVTIGKDSLDFGGISLNLDDVQNRNELVAWVNECADMRFLCVRQVEVKKKLSPKEKVQAAFLIFVFIACLVVPNVYYFMYDRMPFHLIGKEIDSDLLMVFVLVSVAVVARVRAKVTQNREYYEGNSG